MRLDPGTKLNGHLAGTLLPVYLVAGEELLLVQESADAIRAAARKAGYSEREVLDADRSFDWDALRHACNTGSLFAQRRVVEIRFGGGPDVEGGKVLRELAAAPPPDVLLLVVAYPVEGRARTNAWYTSLEEAGAAVHCWPVRPGDLHRFIEQRLRAARLTADPDAVDALAERTEGNLLACVQDIEKLRLLCPDGHVGADVLARAVADSARFDAFDGFDCILAGDHAGAVRALTRMREEGTEVPAVIGAFAWNLRLWAAAAENFARRGDVAAACRTARVPEMRIPLMEKALPRVRAPQVAQWLRRLYRIDVLSKSSRAHRAAWNDLITWAAVASGGRVSPTYQNP